MSATNADEPNTDNTGRHQVQPAKHRVKIEAIVPGDLHLGDERVIHGDGDGHHEEQAMKPKTAMVDPDTAEALVKAKKAKRA